MTWDRLLCTERLVGSGTVPNAPTERRNAFQRDFDRIAYSAPFRRLQNKTQVHTLPHNDHVRNRLTHSLEASTLARSLATGIAARLHSIGISVEGDPLANCAAAATLAHDIGNPPFGHPGEIAIQDWFKYSRSQSHDLQLNKGEAENFTQFNGNAQGFRILTKYNHGYDPPGLQLTCATLAAFTKYPTTALEREPYKKPGLFTGDEETFAIVAKRTGLPELAPKVWARHPLVFVVEAADDIAYSTADIEDGAELGLISASEVKEIFRNLLDDPKPSPSTPLSRLRSILIRKLLDAAQEEFVRDYQTIMAGNRHNPLLEHNAVYEELTKTARDKIFSARDQLVRDIAGQDALNGLLKRLSRTACEFKKRGRSLDRMRKESPYKWRLLKLIDAADPEMTPISRVPPNATDCEVLHVIVDFVAGQTDRYAVELWQKVRAMDL